MRDKIYVEAEQYLKNKTKHSPNQQEKVDKVMKKKQIKHTNW